MKFPIIHKEILALSIPAIVTNITTPLLGIVDVAIAGHMGSAVYIAAIAVGGTMFNMLYWLFAFLRMGTSGMTAQAYGARDFTATSHSLYRALIVALLVGLAIVAMQVPLGKGVLAFIDSGGEATGNYAWRYFSICVWGAPAFLGTFALSGWFLGMQDSKASMWVSIVINMVNIAVSLLLVYAAEWGIEGIAVGTLTAQWVGFLTALVMCRREKYGLKRASFSSIFLWSQLKRFFSVNVDIFLRTVCLIAVTVWFTRMGAQQGAVTLAVNALLMQLFMLFSYFMDGFAFAGEALAGRFIGERNQLRLSDCVKALMLWGLAIAVLFTAIYALSGQGFLSLLSSDAEVIAASGEYFWWAVAIPFAGFVAFTWDGIFIGATLTRMMLLSMFSAAVVFFAIYQVLYPSMGNHALWLAFISYLVTRGITLTLTSKRLRNMFQ